MTHQGHSWSVADLTEELYYSVFCVLIFLELSPRIHGSGIPGVVRTPSLLPFQGRVPGIAAFISFAFFGIVT